MSRRFTILALLILSTMLAACVDDGSDPQTADIDQSLSAGINLDDSGGTCYWATAPNGYRVDYWNEGDTNAPSSRYRWAAAWNNPTTGDVYSGVVAAGQTKYAQIPGLCTTSGGCAASVNMDQFNSISENNETDNFIAVTCPCHGSGNCP